LIFYSGERLTDSEVEQIFQFTGTEEDLDGNIRYKEFIEKVMTGYPGKKLSFIYDIN
jgi:Ca2+-binding EF-hand superfamily protein